MGLDDALGVTDNDGVSVPDGLGSCETVAEAEGVLVPLGVAELVSVAA